MSEQPVTRRLFAATWPPADLVSALEDIERPPARGLRWTTEAQWHVTLLFLGRVAEDELPRVRAGLGRVATTSGFERPVVAVAGPSPQKLGKAVWMIPVAGLEGLAGAVAEALAPVVPSARVEESRPFRGHLTLARAKRPQLLNGLPLPQLASSWEVRELTLVNSTLHPEGARYDVIDRWSLTEAP